MDGWEVGGLEGQFYMCIFGPGVQIAGWGSWNGNGEGVCVCVFLDTVSLGGTGWASGKWQYLGGPSPPFRLL